MSAIIVPSILACDPCCLMSGVDTVRQHGLCYLHIDVMDGMFVPNITFGQGVVRRLRKIDGLVLDVHLMVSYPDRLIKSFVDAGADIITVHYESDGEIESALRKIRDAGCRAGIAIKPKTCVENVVHLLQMIDHVLVMSVEPGKCGQKFMPIACDKLRMLVDLRSKMKLCYDIAVDGGIDFITAKLAIDSGAKFLVTGSSFFKDPEKFVRVVDALS